MILDNFSLAGKTALVTGSATGIGRAIAVALAEAGADVACHGRSEGATDEVCTAVSSSGRRSFAVAGDLADVAAPARMVSEVESEFGRIDILINNAGTVRRAPAAEFSEEDWSTVVNVNLSSVFRLAQAVGRGMLERGSGKIVNIASLLSFQGGITVPA